MNYTNCIKCEHVINEVENVCPRCGLNIRPLLKIINKKDIHDEENSTIKNTLLKKNRKRDNHND
jgi:hypothetical protein